MSWEAIAGLSSALIALCALGLTLWQIRTGICHNKLSVKPHLTTWSHEDHQNHQYSVELLNNGIGPAFFESFQIQIDGQPVSGEGTELMEKVLKILFPQYQYSAGKSYFSKGYIMAEKETRNLVSIEFYGNTVPSAAEIEHAVRRTKLVVTYKSIYNEVFTYDSTAHRANTPLQGTPASGRP